MVSGDPVGRPTKKNEYSIFFASNSAEKNWQNLVAVRRNNLADTWEFLTKTPLEVTPLSYPLKGELATVTRNGVAHDRWQRKLTASDGIRIWYFVIDKNVYLEQVHTSHPNQTK